MDKEQFYYDNKIVKMFLIATVLWGVVGMLVGLIVALLFIFPNILEGISWLSFGRLRPLHTNAVIFAFVGNMMFAGTYHSTQRLVKARLASAQQRTPRVSPGLRLVRLQRPISHWTGRERPSDPGN